MGKLYKNQKNSLYYLSKYCGCSMNTLYEYARGKHKIENMPIKLLKSIAEAEGLSLEELYKRMRDYEQCL